MGTPFGFGGSDFGGFNSGFSGGFGGGFNGLANGFGEAFGTFGAGFPDIGGGDGGIFVDLFSNGNGGFAGSQSQGNSGGGSIFDILGGILGSRGGQDAIGGLLGGLFGGGSRSGSGGGGSNDQLSQLLLALGGQQGNSGNAGVFGSGAGASGLLGSLGALAPLLGLLGNREDERAKFGSLNPAFASLLNVFGSQLDPERGVVNDPNNPGAFKGTNFLDAIRELTFNAPGLSGSEQRLGQDFLNSGQPDSDLSRARERLGRLLGQGEELISTGFRTSAQPAFDEAERRLRQNILPQIAEIAGQNVGISSSSFLDSANRASSDLLGEASIQQLGLDEAAANRRASGQSIFGQLVGTELGLQPAFANDLSALGGSLRNVTNAKQARPLDVFQILSGLGNGQQFIQQGFNPQGNNTTQLFEGLASALPELGSVLNQSRTQGRSLSSIFG